MFVENVPCVVAACCIFHNICVIHEEAFDDDWIEFDVNSENMSAISPNNITTND